MNERLQELARQAGFYANPDVEKFEKFAELNVAREYTVTVYKPSAKDGSSFNPELLTQ